MLGCAGPGPSWPESYVPRIHQAAGPLPPMAASLVRATPGMPSGGDMTRGCALVSLRPGIPDCASSILALLLLVAVEGASAAGTAQRVLHLPRQLSVLPVALSSAQQAGPSLSLALALTALPGVAKHISESQDCREHGSLGPMRLLLGELSGQGPVGAICSIYLCCKYTSA